MYLEATVCENADLTGDINRRVLLANLRFRLYGLPLYDQPTAPLRLKIRMLKVEVMETGVCHVEPHRGPSRYTTQNSPPIASPLHWMEAKTWRRIPRAVLRRRTRQDWLREHRDDGAKAEDTRTRPIIVQLAHRIKAMDAGS